MPPSPPFPPHESVSRADAGFRVLFESSPLPMWIRDRATSAILEVNDAALALYGFPREEFLTLRTTDLGRAGAAAPNARDAARGAGRDPGRRHRTRDGREVVVEVVSHAVVFEGREASVEVVHDVTGRVRVERQHRSLVARLTQVLDLAPTVVYTLDVTPAGMEVSWVSESVRDTFGLEPADFSVAWWRDHLHPDDRAGALERQTLLLERGLLEHEYRIRHPDGSYRWVDDRLRLIRDADGEPMEVVGAWTDITRRRATESALRESEERFRKLVEQSLVGIFMVREGRLVYANRRFADIVGRGTEALTSGCALEALMVEDDRPAVRELVERLLAGEAQERHRGFRALRPDGQPVEVEIHGSPTTTDGGPGLIGVLIDVTERVRAEQLLRRSEEQLRQAQKMEAVGRLAGGVAHDFNNLLTVITGFAALLEHELPAGSDARRDLEEIQTAAERAASLNQRLLAFSRKQVLQPRVLDLNAHVREIEGMLKRLIGEDVDVRVEEDPTVGRVRVDPAQIGQVIMNLAVNARDAMPRGGRLRISTSQERLESELPAFPDPIPPGRYACLRLGDSGIGMNEATMEHIFEPFFTTKPEGVGTGLGLSTVYGIVKQSGGYVTVESRVGSGTRFGIYLPLAEAPPSEPARTRTAPPPPAGTGTILLVEDEDAVRNLALRVLRGAGYRVLTARTGSDALAICDQYPRPIDLLLTDVILPGLNGGELSRMLAERYPDMRRLFISGYAPERIAPYGVGEPGAPLLHKPFHPDELLRTLHDLMAGE